MNLDFLITDTEVRILLMKCWNMARPLTSQDDTEISEQPSTPKYNSNLQCIKCEQAIPCAATGIGTGSTLFGTMTTLRQTEALRMA